MHREPLHLLLIEDNPGDARLVREAMREAAEHSPDLAAHTLTVVDRLSAALDALDRGKVDVVLLDLNLPDSQGFTTFQRLRARVPECPIVVLTGQQDEALGAQAIREGAQDFLSKSPFDASSLARSVRYARDRNQAERTRIELARAEAARALADGQRAALQALFDEALDAMLILDDASRPVDVNQAACALLDRPRETLLGMTLAELVAQAADARARETWQTALRAGHERGEIALARPDGTVRVVEYSARAAIQHGRNLLVLRDVTERRARDAERAALLAREKAARAEADEQRARLHATFDQAPVAVSVLGPDQVYEVANARYLAMVGRTGIVGKTFRDAFPELPPDTPVFAMIDRLYATGKPFVEDEYRVQLDRKGDGVLEDVYFLFTCQPVLGDRGRVMAMITVAIDVTAQVLARQLVDAARATAEASEARFRVLAEAGAALTAPFDAAATLKKVAELVVPSLADWSTVWLKDETGIRLAVTVHAESSKEPVLRELTERYGRNVDEAHGYASVIRTGVSELYEEITPAMRAAGAREPRHLELLEELGAASAMMIPLAVGGRTFGALSFVRSRTEQRYGKVDLELAEEIGRRVAVALDSARLFELTQKERRRAEEANRAKDEFLGVASHELRTPLNAILGWSRLLRSGDLPEEKKKHALEVIERNAEVQVQLVEDILDVSRIITGKLRLEVALVEPATVLEAAVDVVRPAADAKGVRLQVLADPDAGLLHGDAARLQQIVWNLLANAVKFTPRGGRVHLQLKREESHVHISVADTGKGIESSFLPHVFEQFRQADGSSTRSYGGLGLGLAIVKHLVELHGGQVEAHSDGLGLGATFTVRIPIAPVRSTSQPPPFASPARDASGFRCPAELEGLRVLVVDDQPDARELVRSILERCRAHATTASSAAEAFELLSKDPPDVLVSDIGMPEEDGIGLIRRVRALAMEQGGRTPAIALTAYARIEDRTRALMEGFTNHVSKPVEPQELVAVIAAAAAQHGRSRA